MKRALLTCVLALALGAGAVVAADSPPTATERPAGSGVIVHPDGYVLTAHHVVANARRIAVVTAGEFRAPAVIVSADPDHDLALLKIETVGLSEAPIGYAGSVRLDQEIIVAGFSFGLREVSIVRGRIAAVRTKGVKRVFQVDAAINPGNSGAALFNPQGEVVGIVTTKFSHPSGIVPEGMTFVVPVSYATPLLANIPEFDFAAIGKRRQDGKPAADKMIGEVTRATVRIDTLVAQESATPPAAGSAPSEPRAAARPPTARPAPSPAPDDTASTAQPNQEAIETVNRALRASQQEALTALMQRGVKPPEGMVLIPAGEFLMGTDDGLPDARPTHRVYLSAYWLDQYEATNDQYRRCAQSGVCAPPKDRAAFGDPKFAQHPVTNITWDQARLYCQWSGKRLPTEAEWEKASRGTDGRRYPWGNGEDLIVVKRRRDGDVKAAHNSTEPVGSQAGNVSPYGVYDLVGNVWEWVKDWYAEDYYAVSPSLDPQGPLRGSFRVLRGGAWNEGALELRASYRGWDEMTYWGPTLGVRCAADVP